MVDLGVVIAVFALLLSLYVYVNQSRGGRDLRTAVERIAKELASARAEAAGRETAKDDATRALQRRSAMYDEYTLSHDGLSPGILARTEPLPAEWVADWERRHHT